MARVVVKRVPGEEGRREVAALEAVTGGPNCVVLLGVAQFGLDLELIFAPHGPALDSEAGAAPFRGDLDAVRACVRETARALAHCHASGIVHADVRRTNVLWRAEEAGAAAEWVLIDFGQPAAAARHCRAPELMFGV